MVAELVRRAIKSHEGRDFMRSKNPHGVVVIPSHCVTTGGPEGLRYISAERSAAL